MLHLVVASNTLLCEICPKVCNFEQISSCLTNIQGLLGIHQCNPLIQIQFNNKAALLFNLGIKMSLSAMTLRTQSPLTAFPPTGY